MTPAARIAAAIGLIDAFLDGPEMMDRLLTRWGRENRYAGSGDRRAVADHCHDALRRLRSASHAAGGPPGGRAAMLGLLRQEGRAAEPLFDGSGYGPAPLTGAERAALAAPVPAAPEPVRLDYPDWLDGPLRHALGEGFEAAMSALRERAGLWLRVNRLKGDAAAAVAALAGDGVTAEPGGWTLAPDALRVTGGARGVARSRAYAEGLVEIQDVASQAAARVGAARPGETVLDFCAGGGGKTLALGAEMAGEGRLLVHDADPARMADLGKRAARAGLTVETADPGALAGQCDLVFVDAPCSGSGAWRRNPDAKWRLTPTRLAELTALQDEVLDAAAACVRPGGRLVYATCSLLAEENAARLAAFLGRRGGFAEDPAPGARLSLGPADGGDGFFAARLLRVP